MSKLQLFKQLFSPKETSDVFQSNNIIIDVTRVFRRLVKKQTFTGIDRVTMAYVAHYKKNAQALVRWCGRSWLLSKKQSANLFEWLVDPKQKSMVFMLSLIIKSSFKRSPNRYLKVFLLNTGHISLDNSEYLHLQRKYNMQLIFFVHDLIPIEYPEYCSIGEDIRHKKKMDYILTHAQGIITNSDVTLADLKKYAKNTNQPMPISKSALLASSVLTHTSHTRPIDKPYFVILSTIEPRKNHILILNLWRRLFANLGPQTPHLVIIGKRGWECENIVDLLDRSPSFKDTVTELSSCKDEELSRYLHHCQALLFPSFIEGYGLPLIEALTLSVPIIASDIPVFREIAKDIPEYRDPLDGLGWEEIILQYTQCDSTPRQDQINRIKSFKKPTWTEHFIKVDELIMGI